MKVNVKNVLLVPMLLWVHVHVLIVDLVLNLWRMVVIVPYVLLGSSLLEKELVNNVLWEK